MRQTLLIVLVIYAAGLGAAGQFSKLAVSFLELSNVYGGNEAVLGLAVSLISLVGMLLGLIAGMVVNRIGTKRALVSGLILGAAVSLWQASLPALPILMASRVIEGLAHLLIVVAAPTLIAEATNDRQRASALTLWSTFFGVAFALTAAIAPSLISLGGLAAVMVSHAGWMAITAVLCLWVLPNPTIQDVPALTLSSVLSRHAAAYANPGIAAPGVAWLCYTLTFVSVLTGLPLLTQGTAPSWLASIAPLVSIAIALTLGVFLLNRIAALQVLKLGFALCLTATAVIAMYGFSATTILMLFAATAFVQSSGFAVVPQLNPDTNSRALANGALAQMGNLGNLSGTPILITMYQGSAHWGPVSFLVFAYVLGIVATTLLGAKAIRSRQP